MHMLCCRGKICRGQHCNCRKDVHFRRRLQYCFQEVEAAKDDKRRIKADLRLAKKTLKEQSSVEAKAEMRRKRFEKRVQAVTTTASAALSSSRKQRLSSSNSSVTRPARYESVGAVARSNVAMGNRTPRKTASSPGQSPGRKNSSPSRNSQSPLRQSVRKGVLHSMDGISEHRLRQSLGFDEDISHWDLKHLQVQAPDLTQYDDLDF